MNGISFVSSSLAPEMGCQLAFQGGAANKSLAYGSFRWPPLHLLPACSSRTRSGILITIIIHILFV